MVKIPDQTDTDRASKIEVNPDFPSEFCWDGAGYRLKDPYARLLDILDVDDEDKRCDFLGYAAYHHSEKKTKFKCPVETIYKPMLKAGRYHIQSSYTHRFRSGNRALDRFDHLKSLAKADHENFDYLMFIDLTVPKSVSERLLDPDQRDATIRNFRAAVSEFFKRLHYEKYEKYTKFRETAGGKMIVKGSNAKRKSGNSKNSKNKCRGSEFGAMRTVHVWSSENPLEPHLHAHTVMPNVSVKVKRDRTGSTNFEFHRIKPRIDADLLRRVWRTVLIRFGMWNPDNRGFPVVHIRTIKFRGCGSFMSKRALEDNAKISHRLSYMCRLPLEDLNANLQESDLDDVDEDWARFLINYTTSRANLGVLSDLKRVEYNSNISIPPRCPIYGAKLFFQYKITSSLPDELHLVRVEEGVWESVPPPPPLPDVFYPHVDLSAQPKLSIRRQRGSLRGKIVRLVASGEDDIWRLDICLPESDLGSILRTVDLLVESGELIRQPSGDLIIGV